MRGLSHDLRTYPIHLGRGARAEPQPAFTDMEWYEAYGVRTAGDGDEGRLVSMHDFTEDWQSWEVHPQGEEVVICIAGEMTLYQELQDGSTRSVTLQAGQYAINPAAVWHTADVSKFATALFITAGRGTLNRPR